jgi:hypothetical protein
VLAFANMRLVFHIARYYKFRGVAYPDTVQEGSFGLIKAIQKYDYEEGFKFGCTVSFREVKLDHFPSTSHIWILTCPQALSYLTLQ